ncbi:MAG: nitroreductase family protein, partial [Nitrosopumilaceae archaeon]
MSKANDIKDTRIWPKGYVSNQDMPQADIDFKNKLLNSILTSKVPEKQVNTELFYVMSTRRSTRKFSLRPVEQWKV